MLTRPIVVLRPLRPHHEAGSRTDPPVSVPIAQGANPAATATPEPLLDPPGVRARLGVPRVPRGAAMLVGAPPAHRELDRMRLTDTRSSPAAIKRWARVAVIGRAPLPPDLGPAGRDPPLDLDQVLERDRNAVPRADPMPRHGSPSRPPRRRAAPPGHRPRQRRAICRQLAAMRASAASTIVDRREPAGARSRPT